MIAGPDLAERRPGPATCRPVRLSVSASVQFGTALSTGIGDDRGPMMQAAIALMILWVLALMMGSTFGGLTHLLLIVAVVLLVLRMAQGRSVLRRG